MRGVELLSLNFQDALRASSSLDNQVVLYIGENGAGKSRLLERIGRDAARHGRPLILIANTAFDRFSGIRGGGVKKLRVRGGARVAESVLKRAISDAVEKDEVRLRRISRVLEHCRYGSTLGVSLHRGPGNTRWRGDESIDGVLEDKLTPIVNFLESEEVPYRQIIEIDFESPTISLSRWNLLPRLIRHESVLKRLGFLDDIRLHLRRHGEWIQLRNASSGELSLITTMSFLAVNATSNTLVLVDEPENSLHPRWQQDYLDVALQFLGYEGAALRVATHSPLLVSSAGLEGGAQPLVVALSTDVDADWVHPGPRRAPVGVDGILTEAFNTVTPESHYLSLAITELLEKLAAGSLSLSDVNTKISEYQMSSEDSTQVEALSAVRELAVKIDSEGKRDAAQ